MESSSEKILVVSELEPRLKHPTVFQYFNDLKGGESFILQNDHDPKPLFYQLKAEHGDTFTWDYLEEGPEVWKIRITRGENESGTIADKVVLNATLISPQHKHATIFAQFDNLREGDSFILKNDHDPQPLRYQMEQSRGNVFEWEYLEEGPEWWQIRITKRKPQQHPALSRTESGEYILNATLVEPQVKHASIINFFDQHKEGESFILKNDHDPKPLYYQLQQLKGDIFTWTYLKEGPEWWMIRIAKKELSNTEEDSVSDDVLNATLIEPQYKHAKIFEKFDSLKVGENFVLKNDHDPKPLYYQLQQTRGDVFDWKYIEAGPQWWRIRITKNGGETKSAENETEEDVFDATQIPPQIKHAKIFEKIDSLNPGEFFILKNDHDPVPLYYQLEQTRGNDYSWEYVEKGPQWWRVKIGRNKDEQVASSASSSQGDDDENKLDVTQLPPARKHPTIFERFDELEGGKWVTIYNDHDPKPLYYQLLAERGSIFLWEYLEQGPEWWRVKITKRKIGENDASIGEIATKDFRKTTVFAKYGINYGFYGKKTVKEICEDLGIDVTLVEQELQNVEKGQGNIARPLPFNDWNLDFLSDYIVNNHHSYIRQIVPDLKTASKNVLTQHGEAHPELEEIYTQLDKFTNALTSHLQKEEAILFPFVKQLVKAKAESKAVEGVAFDSIKEPINLLEMEHDTYKDYLENLHKLTDNYTLPSDKCASYELMYKLMQDLEADLIVHAHLENNILFPKAIKLEESISK